MTLVLVGVSSGVNVLLCFQVSRWLMYSLFIRPTVTGVSRPFVPILELPGIILSIVIAYLLFYQIAYKVWLLRNGVIGNDLIMRSLVLNSTLLLVLSIVGLIEWFTITMWIPLDLLILAPVGATASLVLFYVSKKSS